MSSPEPGDPDGDRVPACFIACPPDGGTCRPRRVTPATRPPPAGRRPRCPEPSPGRRTRSAELDLCPSGAVPLFPCVHRRRTSRARGILLFKSPAPSSRSGSTVPCPVEGAPYPARNIGSRRDESRLGIGCRVRPRPMPIAMFDESTRGHVLHFHEGRKGAEAGSRSRSPDREASPGSSSTVSHRGSRLVASMRA